MEPRYIVKYETEDDFGYVVFDEFNHNGKGFTYENARKLARILRDCDRSKHVFISMIK